MIFVYMIQTKYWKNFIINNRFNKKHFIWPNIINFIKKFLELFIKLLIKYWIVNILLIDYYNNISRISYKKIKKMLSKYSVTIS